MLAEIPHSNLNNYRVQIDMGFRYFRDEITASVHGVLIDLKTDEPLIVDSGCFIHEVEVKPQRIRGQIIYNSSSAVMEVLDYFEGMIEEYL
jgi:hypothetical protein